MSGPNNSAQTLDQVLEQLDSSQLILTPNLATAQALRKRLIENNQNSPITTPNIFSIGHWFKQQSKYLEQQSLADGSTTRLASEDELLLLWEQVIKSSKESSELSLSGCAQIAVEAHRTSNQLQELMLTSEQLKVIDSTPFQRWNRALAQELKQRGLETKHNIFIYNIQYLKNLYSSVLLYGFIESISPFQHHILNLCCDSISALEQSDKRSTSAACEVSSFQQELELAAHWSKQIVDQSNDNRIAIIVPSLRENRSLVERTFQQIFACNTPAAIFPPQVLTESLAIRTALALLELNRPRHKLEFYCQLLRMPDWGRKEHEIDSEGHPFDWRVETEHALRSTGAFELTTQQFRQLTASATATKLETSTDNPATLLSTFEEQCRSFRRAYSSPSAADWASLFNKQLSAIGWQASDRSQAVLEKWQSVLDRLAATAQVLPECSLDRALQLVSRFAKSETKPNAPAELPISIIDTVESAVDYTHIWMLEAHQYQWPQPPKPNALLPVAFQIEHQLPRSSAERELQISQRLLDHLCGSKSELMFSYAAREGERNQQLTPLLKATTLVELKDIPGSSEFYQSQTQYQPTAKMELVDCGFGPELPIDERKKTRGGSRLLQNMAACPFSTFVIHRLGGEAFPEPVLGLSPMERGNLTHRALELVWNKLSNYSALVALDAAELQGLAENCVKSAVQDLLRLRYEPLSEQIIRAEEQRLSAILQSWLEMESSRTEFTVVATEESRQVELGPLNLRVKVDRIDTIGSSRESSLIIDYKTSAQLSSNKWLTEIPEEPQLPLYAISSEPPPTAIAFGQINAKSQKLIGISTENYPEPQFSKIEQWESLLTHWRDTLSQLAFSYANGDCSITPKKPAGRFNQDELASIHRWSENDDLIDQVSDSDENGANR